MNQRMRAIIVLSLVVMFLGSTLAVGMQYPTTIVSSPFSFAGGLQPPSSFVTNYSIPVKTATPDAIVPGPDHTLWFTEYGNGSIGEFNSTSKAFANYTIPEKGAIPVTLAFDGPGEIWFTDQNPSSPGIWLFNLTGTRTFHRFLTNATNSSPVFVQEDPTTRNIWFTDTTGDYVGMVDHATQKMTRFPAPTANSGPVELAFQNGTQYLWMSEISGRVARFDTTNHNFTEYVPSLPLSYPVGIVVDKQNNVWVSEHGGSSIVEFTPSTSTWKKYPTSQATASPGSGPATLAIDSKGRLWFAEHYSGRIGRLDPASGLMEEYTIPFAGAYSLLNSFDSAGNYWFAMAYANSIGTIPGNATTSISIRPVTMPSSPVAAGTSTSSQFNVTNNLASQITLNLGVTSFFTTSYQTTSQEVSLSKTSLTLGPGQSTIVTATVTPDPSLSSGMYTAGMVASYGTVASIGTFFLQVTADPWYPLVTLLPWIIVVVALVLAAAFLLFRRRKARARLGRAMATPKLSVILSLLILVLFLIQETGQSWAKCPGLPPPPVNPNGNVDYYGIALDLGSIVFFGIVAYLLIRRRLRGRPSPEGHGKTSP